MAPEHDQCGGAAEVRFGSCLSNRACGRDWQFERQQLIDRHELPIETCDDCQAIARVKSVVAGFDDVTLRSRNHWL